MKTELKEVSPIEREIKIEIEAESVREVYNRVSHKYAKSANVPGFRKGLAPVDVVRVRFKEEIKNEVVRELLPNKVQAAIEEYGLMPLTEPHLHFEDWDKMKVNGSEPIKLHIHFEVMPDIPEPVYSGLEAVRRVKPVEADAVDNILQERRQEFQSLIPVEGRVSADGDTVMVDLEGTFAEDPGADPIVLDDLEIRLGDPAIEESFTSNLLGVSAEEEKEFTVSYPEEFSAPSLAGKTVNYRAKIKTVGTVELPELDDEFAKSLDEGFDSIAELRGFLAKDLEAMAKSEADVRVRNDLINTIIRNHEFPVPNALIESQARNLLDNFARDMQNRGFDLNNVDENFVRMAYEQMKKQAEFDVRGAMLLEKIAELENIEVSEAEVSEEIRRMADYYGRTPEEIRMQKGIESSISNTLRTRKAVEAVFEKANVSDGEWIDPAAMPPEAEAAADPAEAEAGAKKTKKASAAGEAPKKKAAKKKE